MGYISKTFKSGNSEAVRLPKALGFGPGTEVEIVRKGDTLIIQPRLSEAERLKRQRSVIDRLKAMPDTENASARLDLRLPARKDI